MLELKESWGEGMSFVNVEPPQPDSEEAQLVVAVSKPRLKAHN